MKVPNIPTTNGGYVPVTNAPDSSLVGLYLEATKNKDYYHGEREMVSLLNSTPDCSSLKAAKILRMCLEKGHSLVAVYPDGEEIPPKGAKYICDILDGSLYLI